MKKVPESRYRRWIQKQGYGNIRKQQIEKQTVFILEKDNKKRLVVSIGGEVTMQEEHKVHAKQKYFHYLPLQTDLALKSQVDKSVLIAEKIRFDAQDSTFRTQKENLYQAIKDIKEGSLGWVDGSPDSVWGLLEIESDLCCYFYCPRTPEIPISQQKNNNASLLLEFEDTQCVQAEGIINIKKHQIPAWVKAHPLYQNKTITVFYFIPQWIRKTDVSKSPWDTIELLMSSHS